ISPRTDVYALGVVLYEMITGKPPFDKKQSMSTLVAHVNEQVQPPSERYQDLAISPAMEAIVMRCLEKRPENRFGSLKEGLNALKRAGGDMNEPFESLPRAKIDFEAAMANRTTGTRPAPDMGSGPKSLTTTGSGPAVRPPMASQPSDSLAPPQAQP